LKLIRNIKRKISVAIRKGREKSISRYELSMSYQKTESKAKPLDICNSSKGTQPRAHSSLWVGPGVSMSTERGYSMDER
jgi:hypothetical protein